MKRLTEAVTTAAEAIAEMLILHVEDLRATLEHKWVEEWARGYNDGFDAGRAGRKTAQAVAWDRARRECYPMESQGVRDVYNPYRGKPAAVAI